MPSPYILARDHLEQAASILRGTDSHTRQLRQILERTMALMEEYDRREQLATTADVVDFETFRRRPWRY